jgi:DNA-binding IclR family transcriptional regulator
MTTLSSAADILRCLSVDRPFLTVSTAAELLGVPKSTASRLLRAMLEAGFLETIGASKKYGPGLLLYEAGRLYRDSSSLIQRAAAVVARISSDTGHTGYVSKREGRDIVAVTDHPGTNALRVASSIGRRLEAFASATGRTLLARMSNEDVRKLYPHPLTPPSPTAPQDIDELLASLATVRCQGFAESHDESNRGVGAIAVAVADPERGDAVSLCIAYPASMIAPSERQQIIDALRAGAAEIAAVTRDPSFIHEPGVSAPAAQNGQAPSLKKPRAVRS